MDVSFGWFGSDRFLYQGVEVCVKKTYAKAN